MVVQKAWLVWDGMVISRRSWARMGPSRPMAPAQTSASSVPDRTQTLVMVATNASLPRAATPLRARRRALQPAQVVVSSIRSQIAVAFWADAMGLKASNDRVIEESFILLVDCSVASDRPTVYVRLGRAILTYKMTRQYIQSS